MFSSFTPAFLSDSFAPAIRLPLISSCHRAVMMPTRTSLPSSSGSEIASLPVAIETDGERATRGAARGESSRAGVEDEGELAVRSSEMHDRRGRRSAWEIVPNSTQREVASSS